MVLAPQTRPALRLRQIKVSGKNRPLPQDHPLSSAGLEDFRTPFFILWINSADFKSIMKPFFKNPLGIVNMQVNIEGLRIFGRPVTVTSSLVMNLGIYHKVQVYSVPSKQTPQIEYRTPGTGINSDLMSLLKSFDKMDCSRTQAFIKKQPVNKIQPHWISRCASRQKKRIIKVER